MCLLVFPTLTYAQESEKNEETIIEISEFEYIKELQSCSDMELEARGLSKEQINEIREFDLVSSFKERASLSEDTLKIWDIQMMKLSK